MNWQHAQPDEIVCSCHNVDKATIVTAIMQGATTITDIYQTTKAGDCSPTCTTCCKKNIEQLIAIYRAPICPEPRGPKTGCCS